MFPFAATATVPTCTSLLLLLHHQAVAAVAAAAAATVLAINIYTTNAQQPTMMTTLINVHNQS
jgi:hypothetical protein